MKHLIAILFTACALAQTGSWPTVATDQDLVVAKTGATSTLSTGINASTLTVVVADGSKFAQYSIIRIDDEFMQICSIATNTLTLCTGTRGLVGSAASHLAGATVRDVVSEYHHNRLRVELKAMQAKLLPATSGTAAPGTCAANRELFVDRDASPAPTLSICNAAGTGWTAIAGGGVSGGGSAAYITSITVSTGSYAMPESTHERGLRPHVTIWSSAGVDVDAGIVLDNPGVDGDLTFTLENGTYFVSVEPGDGASAYTAAITVSAGTYAIPGSTHLRGKWPRVAMWTDAGVQVKPGIALDNPDVDGDLTLTATNGDYFVSIASGSQTVESGGSGDVTSNTATSVDGEMALFNSTTGKQIKRSALTGVLKSTAGVAAVVTGTATDCVFVNGTSGTCGSGTTFSIGGSGILSFVGGVLDGDTAIVCRKGDSCAPTGLQDWTGAAGILIKEGTPASSSATCTKGTMLYDGTHLSICIATNTWKRTAIATW